MTSLFFLHRPGRSKTRFFVAGVFLGLAGVIAAQSEGDSSLEDQLERARELSLTAPWSKSRDLLDKIESRLPDATPKQRANFWLIRARSQMVDGQVGSALETLRALFDKPLTLRQEIRAYSLAANAAMLLRHWEETFSYLNHALELSEELDPPGSAIGPASLAASVYARIGETEKAIYYGKQALSTAQEHGNRRDLCVDHVRLAYAYKTAERREEARHHYQEALKICLEVGDELLAGTVESGLADLLRSTGETESSRVLFQRALSRLKETGYQIGLAEARLYKARLHWAQGEFKRVETLLDKALPPLERDQAWDYVAEAYGMLSEIETARGNHEQALAYTRQQLESRERFLDLERARQLAHLQVAFDTRSREQELALLREQQRVSELQAESRRHQKRMRWLAYGFGGFLFLSLTLLLIRVLRERRHFRRLAGLDSLTALNNHTRFFDTARMMIDKAHHDHSPLVLVLGDIDYFKRVNDEFGHIAGDQALKEVAKVLRETFPGSANIGRIGGEEFALCLPEKTVEGILPRLEAVREALGTINYGGNSKPLTMSFGVAQLAPDEALEALRRRADEALYRAKNGGRNSIVIADNESGST